MGKEEEIRECLARTAGYMMYNGWSNSQTMCGYHSYDLPDIKIKGQRTPSIRLEKFRKFFNFTGKKVIDFGCNVGAMLHHLEEIEVGLGFDYDLTCIESAKNISNILGRKNLTFVRHDFDRDGYGALSKSITFKPDVIFLLSIGSWVSSWSQLYEMSYSFHCPIFLETNNKSVGVPQLEFFRKKYLSINLVSENSDDDTTGNIGRKTYFIN